MNMMFEGHHLGQPQKNKQESLPPRESIALLPEMLAYTHEVFVRKEYELKDEIRSLEMALNDNVPARHNTEDRLSKAKDELAMVQAILKLFQNSPTVH